MELEIERKFLVLNDDYKRHSHKQYRIVQAYLSSNRKRTVRVRIKGDKAFLTIKGCSTGSGLSRLEWEKEIGVNDANDLLAICEPGAIDKVRYEVLYHDHLFEIDEFSGDNEGLVVAEIELKSENEAFDKPSWLGREVTGDARYYNSMLTSNPYMQWSKDE